MTESTSSVQDLTERVAALEVKAAQAERRHRSEIEAAGERAADLLDGPVEVLSWVVHLLAQIAVPDYPADACFGCRISHLEGIVFGGDDVTEECSDVV